MVIEEVKNSELEQVFSLLQQHWTLDNYSLFYHSYCRIKENQSRIYVVKDEEKIIGCCMLHLQYKLIRNGCKAGFIEEVIVDNQYRKKGVGEELIRFVIEEAKKVGCYKVTLSCFDELISFYTKCGFFKENNTMRYNVK